MAYTTLISPGPVTDILQNVVYALPGRVVHLKSDAVVEVSLQATTGFTALATSTTGVETAAVFVRCTTANTKIVVKTL